MTKLADRARHLAESHLNDTVRAVQKRLQSKIIQKAEAGEFECSFEITELVRPQICEWLGSEGFSFRKVQGADAYNISW